MKLTTLVFVFREKMKSQQQILLAMKKRGFGVNKWYYDYSLLFILSFYFIV